MKTLIIYACEYCSNKSPNPEDIRRCEERHRNMDRNRELKEQQAAKASAEKIGKWTEGIKTARVVF